MLNPFNDDFDQLLQRLVELQNFLFLTRTMIDQELKKQKSLLEETITKTSDQKAYSELVFRDITGSEDTGRGTGESTGIIKNIVWAQYEEELRNMMSIYTCGVLLQACEAFNGFLKDMFAIQLKHAKSHAESIDKKFLEFKTYDEYKDHVRNQSIDTSGKTIFQIFDVICPTFKQYHFDNHWGIDLTKTYEVLVKMRNAIAHNSSKIKIHNMAAWDEEHDSVFKSFCDTQRLGNELYIKMSYNHGHKVLKNTAELGFTNFKALSICNNYDWDIFGWEKE